MGDDSEFVAELSTVHRGRAWPTRDAARAAASGDAAGARRAAHTLKGNGLTFGARELASLCLQAEAAAERATSRLCSLRWTESIRSGAACRRSYSPSATRDDDGRGVFPGADRGAPEAGQLESLVENSPVAVIVMDSDERVTDWNPAAATLFGYSADEALGRPIDDLVISDAGRDEGREVTREAIATGRAQRITSRRRKDGTAVDVELMLAPLSVEGARVGFLAIYHDLTEVQRAREHAETLLTVTQVLGKTLSLEDTIETIIGELQRVVPYDSCCLQVIQGNRLVIVGGRGFDDLETLLGQGFDLDDESSINSHVVRSKRTRSSPTSRRTRSLRATSGVRPAFAAGSARR